MSETSSPNQKRIYEHKSDFKKGDKKNVLFWHNLKTNHNSNFKASKMLVDRHNKKHRELNPALFLITILLNKELFFFQLIPLFSQLRAKKLQGLVFKLVFYRFFLIFTFDVF